MKYLNRLKICFVSLVGLLLIAGCSSNSSSIDDLVSATLTQQSEQNIVGTAVSGTLESNLQLTKDVSKIQYDKIPVNLTDDGAFIAGQLDANITIVLWGDFFCARCHDYEPTIRQFIKDYVETGKAKFEFRFLQTSSPNDALFRLAQCAGEADLNSFFEAREMLFDMTSRGWDSATSPRQFATDLGIEYSEILNCTASANQLATDTALAQDLNIGGIPTIKIRNSSGEFIETDLPTAPNLTTLYAYIDSQIK